MDLERPDFFNLKALEKELEALPPLHRLAFAASICERLLPNYNAFSRMENYGDPSVLRKALDEVWQILEGKPVDTERIQQFYNGLDIICPDSDDYYDSYYTFEAQEALFAIRSTLRASIHLEIKNVLYVVEIARFDTIELFIKARDESFNSKQYNSDEEVEAIANHPFAVRELKKENEDLQRLKETETLDKNFLEWLRTSFNNGGKSVIDVD